LFFKGEAEFHQQVLVVELESLGEIVLGLTKLGELQYTQVTTTEVELLGILFFMGIIALQLFKKL